MRQKLTSLRSRLPALIALVIGAWIAWRTYVLLKAAWPFNTDDAYITLRYARHLAAGQGVTWNVHQYPVEGYSNFLFVLIGAAAIKAGITPMLVFKYLSSAALFGTCLVTYRIMRRWVEPIAATLPALIITAYGGTILWTVSGLETAVYQFLLLASITAFFVGCEALGLGVRRDETQHNARAVQSEDRRRPYAVLAFSGLLAFLASLARPEGPLISIATVGALGVVTIWRFRKTRAADEAQEDGYLGTAVRSCVVLAASFGIPYLVYFGWRYQYFGHLFPNTVYCKAHYRGNPWALIHPFWNLAYVLLILSALFPWKKFDIRVAVLFCIPLFYVAALYNVDPIISYNNRDFLPAYACVAMTGMAALVMTTRHVWQKLPRHVAQLLIVVALVVWVGQDKGARHHLHGWASWYARRMAARKRLGEWLDKKLKPDQWFVIGDAGMVPYKAHARVADAFCLNSWRYTSKQIHRDPRLYINWLMALKPAVIVVHSSSPTQLRPRPEYGFYPRLVRRTEFRTGYRLVRKFGAHGDGFWYWVYVRKSLQLR